MFNIINPSFWFDMTPVRMGGVFTVGFFVLFCALVMGGAIARVAKRNADVDKPMKHFLEHVAGSVTMWGVLGFVWLFLSFEEISFFGSRFWFLFWLLSVAYSAYKLYVHAKKEMPEERLRRAMSGTQSKYLPRRAR